jgi:glycosyltransferase involved in cell wall biosynthesis
MIHVPSRLDPDEKQGPLVTYIISTYNRPDLLRIALASALAQDYRNLQVLVVRDGGEEVKETIDAFDDDRLEFIDRAENRGKCYSYNQAFQYAKGKYVAYLDDDDLHYACHVRKQIQALEGDTDCQAAYSDLYGVAAHHKPDGSRTVLGKMHMVSRDYSPWFMMQFNCAPGGATIHRTDLYDRVGPYNEDLKVMIDWDYARRISFYTDLHHVAEVTGEFYVRVNKDSSDRISDRGRRDRDDYHQQCRHLCWARPAKPWLRWKDTSIFYLMDEPNPESLSCLGNMLSHTLFPYLIYLPLCRADIEKCNIDFPALRFVEVEPKASSGQRVDACLEACEGDLAAIVSDRYPAPTQWIEPQIWALMHDSEPKAGYHLPSRNRRRAALVRVDDLRQARRTHPHSSVWRSMQSARIQLKHVDQTEGPFYFDGQMRKADDLCKQQRFEEAGDLYRKILTTGSHFQITKSRAAWCYMREDGRCDDQAVEILSDLRTRSDNVDFIILQAKALKRLGRNQEALDLYRQADQILQPYEVPSV